ncbi:MAG: ATP-binding cassette domain-containing protein [Streptosporangiales bacterium]|nr:ATP-binding cassette domain-containing protein [Streptosporangiales bacterium]
MSSPPTLVVDDLHVTYRVLVGGKRAPKGRRLFLKRALPLRGTRRIQAVRGVSFVGYEGEAIGVVGRNGSGKSTLLRAIAGLVVPAKGAVYADGQPALLGVNAALINDLSGERNVTLGGLALGLSPKEVRERYQDIVEFADIGDFINLPMRTYSSGMAARLRFAIATATTRRVLLVDEALATGDAEFRDRSEEKIRQLRDEAGTVLLVSHNLAEIERSCNRAMWLDQGQIRMAGDVGEVLDAYRQATRARRKGRLGQGRK